MSYLVMECHRSYAVLLDEDGRFYKAANLHYQVGQTVRDPILMKSRAHNLKRTTGWAVGLVAAAACVMLLCTVYYRQYLASDTSIFLTINPAVCMELNRHGDVIQLAALNDDGARLLEGYDKKGKDRVTVADELINRAIEMGFLSEGGRVAIDINAPDEARFQQYGVELRENLAEYLQERITITIEITDRANPGEAPSGGSEPGAALTPSSKPEEESASSGDGQGEAGGSKPVSSALSSITKQRAKEIALAHAGVPAAEAVFESCELETDDGVRKYELEFQSGGYEYKYEVDAGTGKILKAKCDYDDDADDEAE